MVQPTRGQISYNLVALLKGETTRENVAKWAEKFINCEDIEIQDTGAWHYLLTVSYVASKISPTTYLYEKKDIRGWLEEYAFDKKN